MYYYGVYFCLCLPVSPFLLHSDYVCPATNHNPNAYCIHTRTTLIIKIIHRHRSEIVSKDSHLPINYSHKLLLPRSLINSCAATQKEMSSDKWAQDLKAASSAKHFPLQFISNFTVNHQPELATLGNMTTW